MTSRPDRRPAAGRAYVATRRRCRRRRSASITLVVTIAAAIKSRGRGSGRDEPEAIADPSGCSGGVAGSADGRRRGVPGRWTDSLLATECETCPAELGWPRPDEDWPTGDDEPTETWLCRPVAVGTFWQYWSTALTTGPEQGPPIVVAATAAMGTAQTRHAMSSASRMIAMGTNTGTNGS